MESVPDTALLDTALNLWSANATRASMVDNGAGDYVYSQTSIPKTTYDTYREKLVDNGYTEYAATNRASGLNGTVYNYIYEKGNLQLNVIFVGTAANKTSGTVFISATYGQPASAYLVNGGTTVSDKIQAKTVSNASLHMIKTNVAGSSFVIQLKNGHFVINDGGDKGEMEDLLNYLRVLAGTTNGIQNPVVIEAWTVSHLHTDHMALFRDILENSVSLDDVYVEGVYVNQPSNEKCNQDDHPGDIRRQTALFTLAIKRLRTTSGKEPQIYRYEAGQRYYFDDVTMDVLFTQDMLPTQALKDTINEFNDTSTWLKFTIEGKSVLIAGDAEATSIIKVREMYGDSGYLQPDVFVAFHHGINTYATTYNYGINLFITSSSSTQRVLVPQIDKDTFATTYPTRYEYLVNNTNANYRYWSGLGTVTLTFSSSGITYAQTP